MQRKIQWVVIILICFTKILPSCVEGFCSMHYLCNTYRFQDGLKIFAEFSFMYLLSHISPMFRVFLFCFVLFFVVVVVLFFFFFFLFFHFNVMNKNLSTYGVQANQQMTITSYSSVTHISLAMEKGEKKESWKQIHGMNADFQPEVKQGHSDKECCCKPRAC